MPIKQSVTVAKTKVFLVDDHPIVRRGFQMLITLERDMTVCGEADSAPLALEKILKLKPDVAVVDLSLRGSTGMELIKQLRNCCPGLKILVFSMHDEGIYAERVLRAGASGYITKEEGTEKAIQAIRSLVQGKLYVSESLATKLVGKLVGVGSQAVPNSIESLTDRELEVLELLGNGASSRGVAEKLNLSVKTIESHREHIKTKLGLQSANELIKYAFDWVHNRSQV